MAEYAGAASSAVAAVLAGPPRPVAVAAVTPAAVYLRTGDSSCPGVCLAAPGAVRVPCAVVLDRLDPGGGFAAGLRVGAAGTVGANCLVVGGVAVRVGRWWRAPRPVLPAALAGAVRAAWAAGADRLPAVGALLGRGAGLTPYGDDVLAGALVALAAAGSPAAAPLAREVLAQAPTRTTFVSAVLLRHAARGECVPELAAYLTTGTAGAAAALLRVGHSSGAGLLAGASLVLGAAAAGGPVGTAA